MEQEVSEAELEEFRATVRKFATEALAAKAAHWDEQEEFPAENRDLLARLPHDVPRGAQRCDPRVTAHEADQHALDRRRADVDVVFVADLGSAGRFDGAAGKKPAAPPHPSRDRAHQSDLFEK